MTTFDAMAVHKYPGGEKWTKIGKAFPHKTGNGFTLSLHLMPLPTASTTDGDMTYKIVLLEEKREQPSARRDAVYRPVSRGISAEDAAEFANLDDEMPL